MRKKINPEPVEGRDYTVRIIDMDTHVAGVTAMDDDNFASIYLNARQTADRQLAALHHELAHVRNDDFSLC